MGFVLISMSCFSQKGFNGQRFVFNYTPAYSVILDEMIIVSPYLVQHQKLEFGATLNKRFFFSVNTEYSTNVTLKNDPDIIKDNSIGASLLCFRNKRGSFSPIGAYIGLGLNIGTGNQRYLTQAPNDGSSYNPIVYYERERFYLISLYTGQNYILKNHLYLGYGIQWGITLDGDDNVRHLGKPYFKIGVSF